MRTPAPTLGPCARCSGGFFFFFFFFVFLGSRHMEVPRLGVISKLQLPVTRDPSHVCDLITAHSNARSLTH